MGLSRPREATLCGLPRNDNLVQRNGVARTGLQAIDPASGDVARWPRIDGSVEELYDVVVLLDAVRLKALGFKTDEIRQNVWFDQDGERHGRGAERRDS